MENQDNFLGQFDEMDLTEEKITAKLKDFNAKWDSFSPSLYNKMKIWYEMYRSMSMTIEGVATKVPEIFTLIETQLPHLLNSIFSRSMIIDAKAKFSDPTGERTYKIKNYINDLIQNKSDGRRKTELIIKNFLIYGWAITKMYWNTKPDYDIDPETKEVVPINSAHPDFYMVDPFSFAYDPNYSEQKIDGLEWCRERIFIDKNKLKQQRDNKETLPFEDDDMESSEGQDEGREVRKNKSGQNKGSNKTYYDEFWVTFYYKVPVMEDKEVLDDEGNPVLDEFGQPMIESVKVDEKTESGEFTAWFLANNKLIKFQNNEFKFKPFTITRAYATPNEFLGQGEPEIIGAIANQLSYVNLQAGKMVKKVGQNLTFIDPSAGISPQNLKRIEQGVLFVNNIGGIKSEQSTDPQNISVLVKFKEYLNQELQRITGIGPTLQGEMQGDITATQASIVNQNASNRLAGKLTHLQEDFIIPLAQVFFLMSKQLLQAPVQFFDTNNNLIELTPEDFNGNYTWSSNGAITQSNKALQLQQNTEMLKGFLEAASASSNPQVSAQPFTVDIPYFISQHLAPYANLSDVDKIIKQVVLPPVNQQLQAQNQAPIADPQGNSADPSIMTSDPSAVQPLSPTLNINTSR